MKHIKSKLFAIGLVSAISFGTVGVSAAPTAGFSSYMSYISTVGMDPTAGVSSALLTSMVNTAKAEMLNGVTINIENVEHVAVASNGEEDLADNSINSVALGVAINSKYTYTAVAQTSSYINVRSKATTESDVVGKLYNNNVATVLAVEGNWYKIESGDVLGYVRSDLVVVGDDDLVKSLGKKLKYAESKAAEEARLKKEAEKAREEAANNAQKYENYVEDYYGSSVAGVSGEAMANFAVQFVGYPYVLGGNSLTRGTDCSGFIKLVLAEFGINGPRIPEGYLYMGHSVRRSEMQPGDIICYGGHVAMYIGDNKIVHAANRRSGIIISNGIDFMNVRSIRRIVQ